MIDASSQETAWIVIGEAGIDDAWWLVCWTGTEAEAVEIVRQLDIEIASLLPEERDTMYDGYAKDVRPELVPIIKSRRAKLTIDSGYRGTTNGATYRYERLQRMPAWPRYSYKDGLA